MVWIFLSSAIFCDDYLEGSVMLRIEQLQAFCSVAAELHVTRAAKKLQIAQPSLTQQIRNLERDVGIKLFRKQGRGIALTEGGQTFYQEAQIILRQIEAAFIELKQAVVATSVD